ncbi:hypothetical protein ACIQF6_02310 [Kitasatospora sp. NPDC092948]|uniref:hypothetical protein n=1 Tax=Kitasatospora sp. NPDC092948 TaxID=3364088 RepID=UPI003810FAB6
MLTLLRQFDLHQRWLWSAGWLLCAVWAGVFPLVSQLGPHRDWGAVATAGYLLATVVAAPLWRRDTRMLSALLALALSALLPLVLALHTGAGQSEVLVIGRSGTELLTHGTPYLPSPTSVLDLTPYLPAMAVFGLPHALLGPHATLGDPRLWCAAAFLATAGDTWHLLRQRSPQLPLSQPPLTRTARTTHARLLLARSSSTHAARAALARIPFARPSLAQAAGTVLPLGQLPLAHPPSAQAARRAPTRLPVARPPSAQSAPTRLPLAHPSPADPARRTQLPSPRSSLSPSAVALLASPVVALPLTVSGVDLPMTGLLCLALALASRRHAAGAGLALAVACALKWTAWPAVPVAVALLAAVAGGRAAWRCAGVAVTVATALTAPWLVLSPGPLVRQVFAFPLGLGEWRTPAASPLPGHLLAQLGPGGWWLALALLLLGGGAVAISLIRCPPTSPVAAADRLAAGLALAFLLAPAGRFGYLALPLFLALFTRLASLRQTDHHPTDHRPPDHHPTHHHPTDHHPTALPAEDPRPSALISAP